MLLHQKTWAASFHLTWRSPTPLVKRRTVRGTWKKKKNWWPYMNTPVRRPKKKQKIIFFPGITTMFFTRKLLTGNNPIVDPTHVVIIYANHISDTLAEHVCKAPGAVCKKKEIFQCLPFLDYFESWKCNWWWNWWIWWLRDCPRSFDDGVIWLFYGFRNYDCEIRKEDDWTMVQREFSKNLRNLFLF